MGLAGILLLGKRVEAGAEIDGLKVKYESGAGVGIERALWAGGWENAFGCGVKTCLSPCPMPKAVDVSSSSSAAAISSFELLNTRSLSLSLSSYSS